MKAIAINGSPRKTWNTATLLEKALEGAESEGAQTELIHLADLSFKGCVSCFGCKRIGSPDLGKCNYKDALTPVLEKIAECDALILGSPIYVGDVTGMMRNLIERLTFQYISYDNERTPYFKGKVDCGFIFTMNCPLEFSDCQQYVYEKNTACLKVLGGSAEYIMSNETWQFDDYSKYAGGMFDVEAKKKRREEVFPQDCRAAFDLGKKLAARK